VRASARIISIRVTLAVARKRLSRTTILVQASSGLVGYRSEHFSMPFALATVAGLDPIVHAMVGLVVVRTGPNHWSKCQSIMPGHMVNLFPPEAVKPFVKKGRKSDAAAAAICLAAARPGVKPPAGATTGWSLQGEQVGRTAGRPKLLAAVL
jgi:hypothetical protein